MSLFWDPDPIALTIPIVNIPIRWYGLFFALGLLIALLLMLSLLKKDFVQQGLSVKEADNKAKKFTDQLTWMSILGCILGARLVHVFFYDWPYFSQHPLEILQVWHGGLASHGGGLGAIVAIVIFFLLHKKELPYYLLGLLDRVAVVAALVSGFIRVGNFFNQEILGTATDMPWAVTFGHPVGSSWMMPRHPVQLYEALLYFGLFIWFWLKKESYFQKQGLITGLFFVIGFGGRAFLEFFKESQHGLLDSTFQTGQLLSLPFILAGIGLIAKALKAGKKL